MLNNIIVNKYLNAQERKISSEIFFIGNNNNSTYDYFKENNSDENDNEEEYEKKTEKILEEIENSKNAIQLKNDVFVIENEIFDKKIINVMKNLNIIMK